MVNSAPETWHFKTRRLSPFSRHVIALFSILLFDECWKRNPPPPHQLSVENYSALCKSVKRGRRRETATTRTRELWYLSTGPRRDIRNPLLAWRTVFIYLYIYFFQIFLCGRGLVRCTSASMKGQQREVEAGSSRRGTVRKRRRRRRSREKKASKRM